MFAERIRVCAFLLLPPVCLGCSSSGDKVTVIKQFPLDGGANTITQSGVVFDGKVSSDGKGSLKVIAPGPTVVRLFEIGDIDVEDARLIYRARLRTEDVQGQVYLEMYCAFPGKGEFFSRGLQSPLTGTTNWTTEETPFFLKKGENPDNVKLHLVFTGKGTAWIDDIQLLRAPLH